MHIKQADQAQIEEANDILERNHISCEKMHKAFVKACAEGNLPMVNWMMDKPGKIDTPVGGRHSCYTLGFWFACLWNELNIVNRLLDIQQHDLLKVDALITATDVSAFGDVGGDPIQEGIPEDYVATAFFVACCGGCPDLVQRLLELPAGSINFDFCPLGTTGFMAACFSGHVAVVNLLLQLPEGSINIRAKDGDGSNGFMYACSKGHLSVVKSFLELPLDRFNVNETNGQGETGLEIAVREGHQDVAAAIRQYKGDSSE